MDNDCGIIDPSDSIDHLVAEIERLQERLQFTKRCLNGALKANAGLQGKLQEAWAENERLTKRDEEARCLLTTTPMTTGILSWAEYLDRKEAWLKKGKS